MGFSDVENQVKATPTKKYRTASIAKWFTATATMQLVEAGLLDLDKPVQDYCPEFPKKKYPITTRQLLGHTAGIRDYIDYDEAIVNATTDAQRAALADRALHQTLGFYTRYTDVLTPLESFKNDPLIAKPGTKFAYTSLGYRVLACVMQGAAKEDYAALMQERLFSPLGMHNTLPDDAKAIIPDRVSGYRIQRGEPLRRADMRDVSENLPAGGYLSTATDLVKFALAYNNGLVSEASMQFMATPALGIKIDTDTPPGWRDAIPTDSRYGHGLMLFSKYRPGMVGHTGRQAGGSAILVLLPKQQIAIAIMTNAKGWNGYLSFTMKLLDIVEQQLPADS